MSSDFDRGCKSRISAFWARNSGASRVFGVSLCLCALLLSACSSNPSTSSSSSRYHLDRDAAPDEPVDVSQVPDAVPRWEPRSRGGNKSPYVVWGKSYQVLGSAKGYKQRGIASWYGKKFHGYKTSNGETYSMYEMSAAHKSLPLPTYVRVTNLKNGRSVIVRVNDRGPFHEDRLIDLSYAAAYKLGYLDKGTAYVEVEAIDPSNYQATEPSRTQLVGSPVSNAAEVVAAPVAIQPSVAAQPLVRVEPLPTASTNAVATTQSRSSNPVTVTTPANSSTPAAATAAKPVLPGYGLYIQVGAFASLDSANRLREQVSRSTSAPVFVSQSDESGALLHRVRVGPFFSEADAERARAAVESTAGKALIIQRPLNAASAG